MDDADIASRDATDGAADAFIARWQGVTASELSTSQSFLIDLCRLLGVDAPHPTPEQDYMFERQPPSPTATKKRLPKLVEMLVALGRAQEQEQEGGYVAGQAVARPSAARASIHPARQYSRVHLSDSIEQH